MRNIKKYEAFVWTQPSEGGHVDGAYLTSPREKQLIDALEAHGLVVDAIVRRGKREFDLKVLCDTYNLGITREQAAEFGTPTETADGVMCWLPIVCINQMINWETAEIAAMTDWPDLVGDFDAIKMSGEETIWRIFTKHVVRHLKSPHALDAYNKNHN